MNDRWYAIANAEEVDSPSLLVYPPRIEENIRRMISIAGDADRLRPHVKTHKMSAVVRLQLGAGIHRFKCATLAEMEMAAGAGADDILLAHQPVGPKIAKLVALSMRFPNARLAAIVDDAAAASRLSAAFAQAGRRLDVFIDLDVGMGRTGIPPGPPAIDLYRCLAALNGLRPCGLHAYDGHLHQPGLAQRRQLAEAAMAPVESLREKLRAFGYDVSELVAGGTPTFPIHAAYSDRQLSPGTCLLWDAGYAAMLPDLDFLFAAALLTRVVSKPAADCVCVDLGHKAVAADPKGVRVVWPDLPDAAVVVHSEEHLNLRSPAARNLSIGDVLYGIPWHICPTCNLHPRAIVVDDGRATAEWAIDARQRN
ncbi:MAG TPA: D-TA family PLP-dependent enzyme [Pirellulales bacterium]|jgi:D-serine deaminase-like pyridoxal phosphate-dependent protein|nr:D-TA family PLP-dependent enzyme [Pirellulales bacterium]